MHLSLMKSYRDQLQKVVSIINRHNSHYSVDLLSQNRLAFNIGVQDFLSYKKVQHSSIWTIVFF